MSEPSPRPAIATAPISVILFAQALATQTTAALEGWRRYLDGQKRTHEILLIQETRLEAAPNPGDGAPAGARVFTYERTLGFRDALNAAIATAQHPLLVFCVCDLQYQPADLDGMLKVIDQVDLVVGYRAGGQAPPWRVFLDMFISVFSRVVLGIPLEPRVCWLGAEGWGRRWIGRWIFGVRVLDPECPFRIVRRAIFERLPMQSGGPFAQVEMLAKANHLSCYLAQEPVNWTPPVEPPSDAITFGQDAWLVFRRPEFGVTSRDREGAEPASAP